MDEQHSIVTYRKNLRLELDTLVAFVNQHPNYSKETKAVWSDFMQELRNRNEGWPDESAVEQNESACPPPGQAGTATAPNPGKSE